MKDEEGGADSDAEFEALLQQAETEADEEKKVKAEKKATKKTKGGKKGTKGGKGKGGKGKDEDEVGI